MRIKLLLAFLVVFMSVTAIVFHSLSFLRNVQLNKERLKDMMVEFLDATDVSVGGFYSIEVLEAYENKIGGQVVVINYTTANAGHPHFMLTALENHVAIITLNDKEEVVSAFCV